jgi:dolichyl-phosphate-mannose-protein mannosyltransferase
MAAKTAKRLPAGDRSPSASSALQKANTSRVVAKKKAEDYRSEGVSDYDIFALPSSDYQLLGILVLVAAVVRLFRIYQPSSVVFDEVQ